MTYLYVLCLMAFGFESNLWAADAPSFLKDPGTTIRIVLGTGAGFGHQAAGMVTLRRLRELGYKGPFDIVLSELVTPASLQKYEVLIPRFLATGGDPQELDGSLGKLRVLSLDQFAQGPSQHVTVAIAVGTKGGRDYEFVEDFPKIYNADYVLKLNPRGPYQEYGVQFIHPSHGEAEPLAYRADEALMIFTSVSKDLESTLRFLANEAREFPSFASKEQSVAAIFKSLSTYNLIAAYGLGFGGAPKLARLVSAFSVLLTQNASLPKPGGIVIPLISRLNSEEWAEFSAAFEKYKTADPRIRSPKIFTPQEFVAHQADIGSRDVVIVQVGAIPQKVNEMLFERSDLPPILAGIATASFLEGRGMAYLDSAANEQLARHRKAGATLFTSASQALDGKDFFGQRFEYDKILEFYNEVLRPDSNIRAFFAQVGVITRRDKDQIAHRLTELATFMKDHPIPPISCWDLLSSTNRFERPVQKAPD